ncbi:hypothetical protein BGY98DRAFT_983986 [Russula aff. rugulosa BPL654]|nr:hypothetical protein BGY98DRAFT_983986 [Russula aff. rugulosa BPL654]
MLWARQTLAQRRWLSSASTFLHLHLRPTTSESLTAILFEYSGDLKSEPQGGRGGWKHKLAYSVRVKTYGD